MLYYFNYKRPIIRQGLGKHSNRNSNPLLWVGCSREGTEFVLLQCANSPASSRSFVSMLITWSHSQWMDFRFVGIVKAFISSDYCLTKSFYFPFWQKRMGGGDEGGGMEILIKLSLSSCNNRCLLSQQNLDTNLTENEATPKISLDIPLRRTTAKYFFRSQYALRFVTTPSSAFENKATKWKGNWRGICNGVNSNDAHCPIYMQFMVLRLVT